MSANADEEEASRLLSLLLSHGYFSLRLTTTNIPIYHSDLRRNRYAEMQHTEVSRFGIAASDSKVRSIQSLVGLTVVDWRVESMLSLIEIEELGIGKGGKIVEIKVVRLMRRNISFRRDCVEIGEVVGDIGCLPTDVARHGRGCVRPTLD